MRKNSLLLPKTCLIIPPKFSHLYCMHRKENIETWTNFHFMRFIWIEALQQDGELRFVAVSWGWWRSVEVGGGQLRLVAAVAVRLHSGLLPPGRHHSVSRRAASFFWFFLQVLTFLPSRWSPSRSVSFSVSSTAAIKAADLWGPVLTPATGLGSPWGPVLTPATGLGSPWRLPSLMAPAVSLWPSTATASSVTMSGYSPAIAMRLSTSSHSDGKLHSANAKVVVDST